MTARSTDYLLAHRPSLLDLKRAVAIAGVVVWIVVTLVVLFLLAGWLLGAVALAQDAARGPFLGAGTRVVPYDRVYGAGSAAHAASPLHAWFDKLASRRGLCCSFADGRTVEDVDWQSRNGHYAVRVDGRWIDVPSDALVTEPNRLGRAVVWPYQDASGETRIRCFMLGPGS